FETPWPLTIAGRLASVDWLVIGFVAALALIGTATLYSVAGGSFEPWAYRHALRCAGGLGLLVACALVPVAVWQRAAVPVYLAALAL
ncbi:hypothetical protein AAER32_01655, partial [Pseudomonas aeruginosa]